MKYKYNIIGLDCANCAIKLEDRLSKIDVIDNVSINFILGILTFESKDIDSAVEEINKVINKYESNVKVVKR